jgi:phage shock protein C
MVAGVASGIARHLGLDPTLVRIAFVVLTLAGGSGVLAYIVAWLVIPEETADDVAGTGRPVTGPDATTLRYALGALLVLVGLLTALDRLVPAVGHLLWPMALIVLGVTIVLTGARR